MDTTFISQLTATPSHKEASSRDSRIQTPGNLNTATSFRTTILCTRYGAWYGAVNKQKIFFRSVSQYRGFLLGATCSPPRSVSWLQDRNRPLWPWVGRPLLRFFGRGRSWMWGHGGTSSVSVGKPARGRCPRRGRGGPTRAGPQSGAEGAAPGYRGWCTVKGKEENSNSKIGIKYELTREIECFKSKMLQSL